MNTIKTKGMYWSVLISVMLLAMPTWVLADDSGTPDIERIKQLRQLQNQGIIVKNLEASSIQVSASPEQARMDRLAQALSKATKQKLPNLDRRYSLKLGQKDLQVPQLQQSNLREVIYNQGVLSGDNSVETGLEYFNFLTGENSSDSVGMDVRITGNEGTNFGNESASWGDPSMLYFFSDVGTLDDVSVVDDLGMGTWTTVSWDTGPAGNDYQPLAVGNLWVVYARMSHMYVALEVTSVDTWNQYFEFDYLIQTDGSTEFDGGVEPTLFDMTVDGAYAATLEVGSNPYFEIILDGAPQLEFMVLWDANHDGSWDDGDFPLDIYDLMDGSPEDEEPADGIFGFTYTDEMADGINYFTDDLIFVAFQAMNSAEVAVTFYSNPTPYSVSGYVSLDDGGGPPLEGIIVWAFFEGDEQPAIIDVTDSAGMYHFDLLDTGYVYIESEDHFFITNGFIPDPPYHYVHVMGHEPGYNFFYTEPTSTIQGYVYDEADLPLPGIEVRANTDGPGFSATTDENGFYSMGVMPGWYQVVVDWWTLPQPYMLPYGEDVEIAELEVVDLDLYVITANSMISGSVMLDGAAYPDAFIWGNHPDFGWTATMCDEDGNYELPVFDDGMTLYDLSAHLPGMPNVLQVSENWDVPAGTTGEMILLETFYGGLHGYFINGETGEPLMEAWEASMVLRDLNTEMEYWSGPHPNGYYEMWVPDGLYEVIVWSTNWYLDEPDTVFIDGVQVEHDVVLWPVGFDTFVEGQVYDQLGSPIMDAEVMIGNDDWGAIEYTDEYGYYHINAPYGYYGMSVYADGFEEEWDQVDLTDGPAFRDFYLTPFVVDGAIAGFAFDVDSGDPISGAEVFIYTDGVSWFDYTDEDGEFLFDLPNGAYDLVIEHYEYALFWSEGLVVADDTVYVDAPMVFLNTGLEGYVYSNDDGMPIWDAEVAILSTTDPTIGFLGYSDEDGYYNIPALNGEYQVFAAAPGFEGIELGLITIEDDWSYMDIYLETYEFATAPEINFIMDQPNDQGRQVRMQFWPGGTEWGPFMGYSIWRLTHTPNGDIFDFVDYLPYHEFNAYNLVAPTLVDSSANNTDPQYYTSLFRVDGHYDMYGYIEGEPAAGHSVDNIHPGVPGVLALLSSGEAGVELGWEASMAADFQYFEVQRADNPDFTDAVVMMTVDPLYIDEDVTIGQTYYYTVAAVDANGNVGESTNMVTTSIVSIDEAELLPSAFGLSQNYPNPFNPSTSIEFALPEASNVSLEIYNILGQKVRTLVNGYLPAGYINTSWDGLGENGRELSSGTYIYRLKTADMSFSKKMVLMK
ncbi:MAG: carboxypeptidase regulatory-like domain-containing protein [Candidatus Marinimicrobia bacterium]|nr:carboxypeptidase regulatory-like domain-containing protein [Candidatus Neomarinimicrobiota bacterium]